VKHYPLHEHFLNKPMREADFDPAQHPRDEVGKFADSGGGPQGPTQSTDKPMKWKKSKDPHNEYGFALEHGGRTYQVYWDRDSASWRSAELNTASGPGGSPVDFIGHNKSDVMDKIQSGRLAQQIDKWKKK
jgi:hypothetical protein